MPTADKDPEDFWSTYEGLRQPNYTQMPNEIADVLLPRLSGAELKIVVVLARKTFGWHQPVTAASLNELAKATGIGRATVKRAVAQLETHGVILVHRENLDTRSAAVNLYCLRMANADESDVWQSLPRKDAAKHQLPLDLP